MNRREFLKSALTLAALAPVTRLAAKAGADGDKASDLTSGAQVTRRRWKDSALTLPLLGFGCMRLPRITPDNPAIDYPTVKKMIDRAMLAGCNYFDTAYMYHGGESEKCLGELLKSYSRDAYYLADKMPVWFAKKESDVERIFKEQLARCKTDYFDFYMLHALDKANWELAKKFHACEFLRKMKKEGKIRKLGFSFHDTPETLQTIVDAQEWDFAQIQLNYLDWELYRSREQYEILTKAGIPVIIMEPLRGGDLLKADLSMFGKAMTPVQALDYALTRPAVAAVMAGCKTIDEIRQALAWCTATPEEKDYAAVLANVEKCSWSGHCMYCGHCAPCPKAISVADVNKFLNLAIAQGKVPETVREHYKLLPHHASECIQCGACEKRCPFGVPVREKMKQAAELFGI